jgi:predicted dehydrogenase
VQHKATSSHSRCPPSRPAVLGVTAMAAQQPQPQLSVAFVGCGNISTYHLEAIAAADPVRCRVTALIDPDAARAEKLAAQVVEKGLGPGDGGGSGAAPPRIFGSLQEACAADPDCTLFAACDVMVPSWETAEGDLHEIVGTQVLQAKRHLLMEKPLAVSASACERLIAAHARHCPDKVFMVAENAQYWPEIVQARQVRKSETVLILRRRARHSPATVSSCGTPGASLRTGAGSADRVGRDRGAADGARQGVGERDG